MKLNISFIIQLHLLHRMANHFHNKGVRKKSIIILNHNLLSRFILNTFIINPILVVYSISFTVFNKIICLDQYFSFNAIVTNYF